VKRELGNVRRESRRTIITLIVVLVIVQVAVPGCLRHTPRPATPPAVAGPTSAPGLQSPSASTATPADVRPTPTPPPDAEETSAVIVGPPVDAADIAALARMFDEERALDHLAYLASDELGGRQTGTPDGRAAGDYIAARFAEYGLQPAGVNDTYFQTFTVPYGRITEPPVLDVILPTGKTLTRTYTYRTDYRALTGGYLGAGEGEGPVVWLNECLHDDYGGLDMTGKIVLCRYTRNPEVYRQAIEHQVGGLLLLDRERDTPLFRRGGYRETAWVPRPIPAYLISETVAEDLLIGADYTLDDLSLRFTATPLSTTVRIVVTVEERDEVAARNVLALLPGSNPGRSGEVVVIGAHYDHLGREPDGMIMNGANDNSSGVATVLEIARLWQAQNFHPARSILFAAWDGEEQRLLGSRYYVEHPTYPLTRTVAMLNLDMVGAGGGLQIDGEGTVAAQLRASAEAYGVTTTLTFDGRSDHVPFYRAGIPAAMFIWWPDTYYHTPDDEVETIEPENLKTVGILSVHALAALAEGYVELEQAMERLEASVVNGDRDTFLEGVDPADPDLRAAQAAWFDNLWSQELTGASIEPDQMRIGDGEANVALTTAYRWAGAEQSDLSVPYGVRFVQRDGAWYFAGCEMDELAGDIVTVARVPSSALVTDSNVSVQMRELLSTTRQVYLALAADLGSEPVTSTRVIYYPNRATMRAIVRPAQNNEEGWVVTSAELVEIGRGEPITPALVNLLLNQMGLPPAAPPLPGQGEGEVWLREGLALHYDDGAARKYLPLIIATDVPTPLLDFPALSGLPDREAQVLRAYAWSGVEYLLDRYGADGLRRLCAAWEAPASDASDGAVAFQALGLSPTRFESAWRSDRIAPLRADGAAIQATIAARVEAVLAGDTDGFLSTVTLTDPTLRTEERNWFADLTAHPVITYSVTGQVVGWSSGGPGGDGADEADVALSVSAVISGGQARRVSYDARFVREGNRWRYAGVAWNELIGEHFVLKYQNHDDAWARRVLDLAEEAYAQVTADLDMTPSVPQEIKLYDDPELFRTSVFLSLPDRTSDWTEPGEAIKLLLRRDDEYEYGYGDEDEHAIQSAIAHELAHQVLFAQGLSPSPARSGEGGPAWLHEGVADFEAGRVLPLGAHWTGGRYSPIVQDAVRRHNEFSLDGLSSWENVSDESDVSDDRAKLFRAQSWSLVSFLVERYGMSGLRRFIAQSVISDDAAANLRTALGADPDSFLAEWREHARAAGVPDDLTSLAQRFDPERALAHIATLSGPEFGGRQAGAPGADLAATYIAEQFAALGLQPIPSPHIHRGEREEYLQQFPISHTHLITVPTLTLLDAGGTVLHEFTYRRDFLESAGRGIAEGELVWVSVGDLEGMRFGGNVVLERGVDNPLARAAQLQDHGAGGLVVVTDANADDLQTAYVRPDAGAGIAIPVFEITTAAFETLLERLGMEPRDLASAPPALPLGAQIRQTLVRPVTTTLTANVLGLLPGSDPDLAGEVILVGAHYDHAGRSPDGLYFPGANQNASGVGAMLEMARVWQSAGYRPVRSVLFAAWGAEELGSVGVAHYLADPAVPLTQTVGVIALDSIAGGRGYKLMFHGAREHDQPLIHRIEVSGAALDRRVWRRSSADEGWHAPFSRAGIPTVKLIWDDAERGFYSPDDTAAAIDLDRLVSSGEILTLTTSWLAGR